jgi:hypothetical protein
MGESPELFVDPAYRSTYLGIIEFDRWKGNDRDIISNMRADTQVGRPLLEMICEMQLIEQVDDTLFIHVVPDNILLSKIYERGVDQINTVYRTLIRDYLI